MPTISSIGSWPRKRRGPRIAALHHHLVHLEGRLPTLNELAAQFGLSARRLNDAFAAEYGESIFNFVTGGPTPAWPPAPPP